MKNFLFKFAIQVFASSWEETISTSQNHCRGTWRYLISPSGACRQLLPSLISKQFPSAMSLGSFWSRSLFLNLKCTSSSTPWPKIHPAFHVNWYTPGRILWEKVQVTPVRMHLNLPGNLVLFLMKNILTTFVYRVMAGQQWRNLKHSGSPLWTCQRALRALLFVYSPLPSLWCRLEVKFSREWIPH